MAGKLSSKEKEIIANVSEFYEVERSRGRPSHITDVVRRTAEAWDVSEQMVKRCRRLSREGIYREGNDEEAGPAAEALLGRPKIPVDDFMKTAIRNVVYSFYRECLYPNVHMVTVRCRARIPDLPQVSETTMWRLLRSMKFSFRTQKDEARKSFANVEILWRGATVSFAEYAKPSKLDGR